jgi:hypothetical protein
VPSRSGSAKLVPAVNQTLPWIVGEIRSSNLMLAVIVTERRSYTETGRVIAFRGDASSPREGQND